MYTVMLVYPILELDLDILKMYMHTKIKAGKSFQKLEREQDTCE